MKIVKQLKNRKKGLTIVEASLVALAAILFIVIAIKGFGELSYRLKKMQLTNQVTEINAGANTWKGMRSNFTGLTMTALCKAGQESVSESTCGGIGGTGANSNSFGGSFAITPSTNVSQKKLVIDSLPSDRISELADSLAPLTLDECDQYSGCATITVAATSLTLIL
jgi:hypothetical protein